MPGNPLFLTQSPATAIGLPFIREILQRDQEKAAVDAFSEVLSAVKLQGALFFNAEFSAPWGFASPASKSLVPDLLPGAEHLIIYHLLIEGSAFAQLEGAPPISLFPGEIVMFPHGDPHRMGNGSPEQIFEGEAVRELIRCRNLGVLRAGGQGETTRFVCGYMGCDPQLCRPILSGLPSILKVNIRSGPSGQWLENSIRHMVEQASYQQPGSEAVLAKLSEALFVETLRQYVATLPADQTGWLGGARDPVVGKSLAILHSRVDHPWTVAELAKEVGMSRSALLDRFGRYLSEPPIAYLTRWRMQLGARTLTSTPRSVSEIAAEVGYESEAAFNRAFKREFGIPPGQYRREHRTRLGATPVAHAG